MPDPRPISFLSPGTTPGPRSYSEEGCQGQPASKGSRVGGSPPSPCSYPFPPRGAAGSEEKGQGWETGGVGGNGVYQIPRRLPTGQQLVQVAWLEKLTSGRREAADLLGGRTPAQVSLEKTFKLVGAALDALAATALPSFQACGRERGWRLSGS